MRGISEKDEIQSQSIMRDVRHAGEFITDTFRNPSTTSLTLAVMAFASFLIFPGLSEVCLVLGVLLFVWNIKQPHRLPARIPINHKTPDPSDVNPKNGQPLDGRGLYFMGNMQENNQEVWFSDDDVRTHYLLFGSTGSGKTESLVSMSFNALAQGSGFVYVDGKGDNALFKKIYSAVRAMGREDDLLLVNYMTSGKDMLNKQKSLLSNKINPFATGAGSDIVNLMVGLMDSGGGDKGGDMWKGRAISFVSAIIPALVWKRDYQGAMLDVSVIRQYMEFPKVFELSRDRDLPPRLVEPIKAYLSSLAGYVERNGLKQESTTLEQHGYLQMQFTRILGSLSDTYGFVFRHLVGDVDMYDVVVNRRILVVLLPALEKPDDELSNLGKIIVTAMKGMMGATLGSEVEGDTKRIVDTKPTNSPTPFLSIFDEYGYYAVDGFAVMAAQARSLGFSLCFAGQDFGSFKKRASEAEADAIVGNTNIKGFMKLEDTDQTFKLAEQAAGEVYVTHASGFEARQGGLSRNYMDTNNASIERRSRINSLDLKAQDPGYVHIMWRDKLLRLRMFYANPKTAKRLRVNHFIQVLPPQGGLASGMDETMQGMIARLKDPAFIASVPQPPAIQDISMVAEAVHSSAAMGAFEASIIGLVAHHKKNLSQVDFMQKAIESGATEPEAEEEFDGNSVLTESHRNDASAIDQDFLNSMFGPGAAGNLGQFMTGQEPADDVLPNPDLIRDGMRRMEEAVGASPEEAKATADRVASDLINATAYPSMEPVQQTPEVLLDVMRDLDSILLGDDLAALAESEPKAETDEQA